ncbi:unnamed protein product [Rhizopus stolonifer]
MSDGEREVIQDSPIPTRTTSSHTTEETRLLDSSTKNYSSQNSQTVITIAEQYSNSRGFVNSDVVSGQPLLPVDQLTEKIQDILVFSEIKKNQGRKRAVQKKENGGPSSSSSSSSSSDSDSDKNESRHLLKKKLSEWSIDHGTENSKPLRKRDFAIDALKLATDKWREKHGWFSDHNESVQPETEVTVGHTMGQSTSKPTVVENKKVQSYQHLPSSAESIFGVAKNASVCAILALLHERRQSSGHSTETDVFLQTLALSTLSLGLKAKNTSTQHVVLKEMLVSKWLNGRSALEWAVENNSQIVLGDKRVQAVIEDLWTTGPDWRQNPTHPTSVWVNSNQTSFRQRSLVWTVISRTMTDFFARWASPRYQALVALVSGLIYLGLHLATLSNLDYTSDTPFAFEYAYYVFVASDLLLELTKALPHPIVYLKTPASYLSFTAAGLVASSAIIRLFALIVIDDIQEESAMLSVSFMLLILATPLMFFRLFATWSASSLFWTVAKANYIVTQCIVNSLWVFGLSLVILLGFWVALGALQYDDMSPLVMLRLLILGALHAPEIADTLFYQPAIASILLVFYLLSMVVFIGALLTASFLTTFLEINTRTQAIKNEWVIQRCLGTSPGLNKFIPGVLVDVLFNTFRWISRVIFRRERTTWNEKMHQVAWYIVYSPIILVVGIIELFNVLVFHWEMVSMAFKPNI